MLSASSAGASVSRSLRKPVVVPRLVDLLEDEDFVVLDERGSLTEEGDWQELAKNKETKKTAATRKLNFLIFSTSFYLAIFLILKYPKIRRAEDGKNSPESMMMTESDRRASLCLHAVNSLAETQWRANHPLGGFRG
jgi:hypothetical protein